MTRLNFIVEGTTEEVFVKRVLVPFLSVRGVYPAVRAVETSRHGDKIYRGGMTSYDRARADITRWLKQDTDAYVTTMFDYYALPDDFPGFDKAKKKADPYEAIAHLEEELANDISSDRFIPYVQLHEFESLLFSKTETIDAWLELFNQGGRHDQLEEIMNDCGSAELINCGRETAPSKRLLGIYPAYDKVFLGSSISEDIGVETIKDKCPHFADWLEKISSFQ